jgi:FkbM family methyltransferase
MTQDTSVSRFRRPNPFWQTLRRVKWGLDSLLDICGYKLEKKVEGFSFFSQLLNDRLKTSKEIIFVQIGANDGASFDPLYPLIRRSPGQFRGLVVEPLKDKFDMLKQAYADIKSITPVNLAVHNTEKEMVIHRVRPDLEKKLGPWARGIGSFNPEHHKRSYLDNSHMIAEKVICATFDRLLAAHKISNLELLITDTEGYDFEILRNLDFAKYRPTYIHFEHGLPSGLMSWAMYKDLIGYMAEHGYNISHETHDATAFLPQALRI